MISNINVFGVSMIGGTFSQVQIKNVVSPVSWRNNQNVKIIKVLKEEFDLLNRFGKNNVFCFTTQKRYSCLLLRARSHWVYFFDEHVVTIGFPVWIITSPVTIRTSTKCNFWSNNICDWESVLIQWKENIFSRPEMILFRNLKKANKQPNSKANVLSVLISSK